MHRRLSDELPFRFPSLSKWMICFNYKLPPVVASLMLLLRRPVRVGERFFVVGCTVYPMMKVTWNCFCCLRVLQRTHGSLSNIMDELSRKRAKCTGENLRASPVDVASGGKGLFNFWETFSHF